MSESLTHSFPRSFLVVALSASAVGFADTLWLCPGHTLSRFFASVSWFAPFALSPLLHSVFPDGFRLWCAFRFAGGVSPGVGPVGTLGELRWLHLYRLTPDLVGLLLFAGCLGAPVGVFCLLCDIPPVFMAIFWSVSLTPACPLRVPPMRSGSLDTCVACTWLDLLSSSVLFQDSVICADFWSRQYGPHTTCRDSGGVGPVSLVYGGLTPCYCGVLGGLQVLVGSSTYPSLGRMLGPSYIGLWLCWRLGCRPVPSSHFLDYVYYLACSLDSSSYGFLR